MPGPIERFNGQHIVRLAANVHGITLGEAAPKLNQALAGAGTPPRGAKIVMKGQISPLEQTISGLRIGLLLAVVAIFQLLSANFQSMRLARAVVLTVPAVLCGVLLMLFGHSHNPQHSIVHGRDHGHRHCRSKFDTAGHVRRARCAAQVDCDPLVALRAFGVAFLNLP
jgi:Cu/Ag efflux pump CusA